ncbi:MAG TPA: hypothetical protein VGD57_05730 [Candidatus Dormibacteraeota bacterium]
MTVPPARPDPEQAYRLDGIQRDLVVGELGDARELAREAALTGALGAGTVPAEQLEMIGGLVAVGPADRKQLAGSIRQYV